MKTKIFSFFAGAGFLDLGFERAGHEVAYVNEIHAPFLAAYKHSRAKLNIETPEFGYHAGSVTDFLEKKQEDYLKDLVSKSQNTGSLVGFIGGAPCPDFSIAGKNKGREGDNGKLSKSYIELIRRQQPDFFLFENVRGLWQTKRHRAFYEELKLSLEKAGYLMDHQLINSIEYGVPQDRDRLILLGFHKRLFKKPIKKSDAFKVDWLKNALHSREVAFSYDWAGITPYLEDSVIPCPKGTPKNLTVQYWFDKNKVEDHPNTEHCFRPKAGLVRFQSVSEGDDLKKSFKRLHRWRYSPTAAYGNNEVHLHPYKPRRISVAEALAIQSLPKGFELPPDMTLSNMFKTIGNGVPYLAGKALAQTIHEILENPDDQFNSFGHRECNCKATEEPSI